MRWTLPNTLTVLRLLAAPLLVVVYELMVRPWADWAALGLFVSAGLTDYFDGMLARRWKQVSAFGKMLDPIADKAMTIVALIMLLLLLSPGNRAIYVADQTLSLFGLTSIHIPEIAIFGDWLFVIPAMVIVFREIFISGLREFLGGKTDGLAVTKLAKWKTTIQMAAVAVLFVHLLFEHYYGIISFAMERSNVLDVLTGVEDDLFGLRWKYSGYVWSFNIGITLLWLAGVLTAITGLDYFRKALPFLRAEDKDL